MSALVLVLSGTPCWDHSRWLLAVPPLVLLVLVEDVVHVVVFRLVREPCVESGGRMLEVDLCSSDPVVVVVHSSRVPEPPMVIPLELPLCWPLLLGEDGVVSRGLRGGASLGSGPQIVLVEAGSAFWCEFLLLWHGRCVPSSHPTYLASEVSPWVVFAVLWNLKSQSKTGRAIWNFEESTDSERVVVRIARPGVELFDVRRHCCPICWWLCSSLVWEPLAVAS